MGNASWLADDDAEQEQRRRNARARWKRATTKITNALRLAGRGVESQEWGAATGASHETDEEDEERQLARQEEEELRREKEEEEKLEFMSLLTVAAFKICDDMMEALMISIEVGHSQEHALCCIPCTLTLLD